VREISEASAGMHATFSRLGREWILDELTLDELTRSEEKHHGIQYP
jgi:hypothetical protein